jgi:aminoglycoside phosphotransferase (APT) family kinase protein
MIKMHENEIDIDKSLVYNLLKSQCPHWANLPLKTIPSSGTDNALFRLGNNYVVRLPRIDWATASINKEFEWLPKIARSLNIPISEPVFKGQSDKDYPWSWIVTKWNEGHSPDFEKENEYLLLAKELADFLNQLHGIKLSDGPYSRRGVPLKDLNYETYQAINELEGEVDIQTITQLWRELTNIAIWNKAPVWVHGDFLPGNILVQNNRLTAVIDWSDVGIGDPACDLVIAWSLLNKNSRKIFRENLENIDDNDWERGRGIALSIALIMLPYYKHSNPFLATLARRMIANVLCPVH